MKSKTTIMKTIGFLTLSIAIAFFSCQKVKDAVDTKPADAIALSIANGTSETLYDDAFDVVLQDGESNSIAGRETAAARTGSCATVTLSPADLTTFPKTMTIDFGAGCTSSNGVLRKGKLIAVLSGKIRTAGTTLAVSFDNYSVNGFKVEGNYMITNNGGTGLNFTRQVSNGKLTYPDGTTWYKYTGTHTLAQTGGAATVTFADDNFSVTGNGITTSSAGNSLTVNITTPLLKAGTCRNISSGIEQFTYNTISGSLNFGDGTCDNQALLTVGLLSQTITLPR
jgi:hypothetical protein